MKKMEEINKLKQSDEYIVNAMKKVKAIKKTTQHFHTLCVNYFRDLENGKKVKPAWRSAVRYCMVNREERTHWNQESLQSFDLSRDIMLDLEIAERDVTTALDMSTRLNSSESSDVLIFQAFCEKFGGEVEDEFVQTMLNRISSSDILPTRIKIIGNKDPCPQCQIKLQWLAERTQIAKDQRQKEQMTATGDSPITFATSSSTTICYYSNESHYEACVCIYPERHDSVLVYLTRPDDEIGRWAEFIFSSEDTHDQRCVPTTHQVSPLHRVTDEYKLPSVAPERKTFRGAASSGSTDYEASSSSLPCPFLIHVALYCQVLGQPPEWESIDLNNIQRALATLKVKGQFFNNGSLRTIYKHSGAKPTFEQVQDSLDRFAYGIERHGHEDLHVSIENPGAILFKTLKNGDG